MKIAYITDFIYGVNGGTERQLYMLIEGMVSRGHEVKLFVLRGTDFSINSNNFPCPVHCLDVNSLASLQSIRKLLHFRQKLLAAQVDIVHGFFNDVALILPPLMIGTGIRTYTSRRDMGIWYSPARLWLLRLFSFAKTRLICNSHAVARFAQENEWKAAEAITVIYNGLEPFDASKDKGECDWLPEKSDINGTVRIILVANVRPVKRIEDLVKAAAILNNGQNRIEYYLAGNLFDAAYHESILNLLRQFNLENSFYFLGPVSEPRAILTHFDIGVLTSESEGFSNALIEYLDAGLPVVVSNVGGNPELVSHGDNGFLYQVGDYRALAEYLQKLVTDESMRSRMSVKAKAGHMMHQFDNRTMIERHEAEYAHNRDVTFSRNV